MFGEQKELGISLSPFDLSLRQRYNIRWQLNSVIVNNIVVYVIHNSGVQSRYDHNFGGRSSYPQRTQPGVFILNKTPMRLAISPPQVPVKGGSNLLGLAF